MKKQSGFTLIELLLVLAIIGIISAIAIPALLGQRARARDKATTQNMTGTMADMIGAWDKAKEGGVTSGKAGMLAVVTAANLAGAKNPWDPTTAAYNAAVAAASPTTITLGQVEFGITASNVLVGRAVVKEQIAGAPAAGTGGYAVIKRSNLE